MAPSGTERAVGAARRAPVAPSAAQDDRGEGEGRRAGRRPAEPAPGLPSTAAHAGQAVDQGEEQRQEQDPGEQPRRPAGHHLAGELENARGRGHRAGAVERGGRAQDAAAERVHLLRIQAAAPLAAPLPGGGDEHGGDAGVEERRLGAEGEREGQAAQLGEQAGRAGRGEGLGAQGGLHRAPQAERGLGAPVAPGHDPGPAPRTGADVADHDGRVDRAAEAADQALHGGARVGARHRPEHEGAAERAPAEDVAEFEQDAGGRRRTPVGEDDDAAARRTRATSRAPPDRSRHPRSRPRSPPCAGGARPARRRGVAGKAAGQGGRARARRTPGGRASPPRAAAARAARTPRARCASSTGTKPAR